MFVALYIESGIRGYCRVCSICQSQSGVMAPLGSAHRQWLGSVADGDQPAVAVPDRSVVGGVLRRRPAGAVVDAHGVAEEGGQQGGPSTTVAVLREPRQLGDEGGGIPPMVLATHRTGDPLPVADHEAGLLAGDIAGRTA